MRYHIKRDLNEYGPYTLADLQRYVAQGNIVMTDLARSEGMTDWVPVSQVLGSVAAPAPAAAAPPAAALAPAAAGPVYSGPPAAAMTPAPAGTVYSGPPAAAAPAYGAVAAYGAAPAPSVGPVPPDLHWALVLVIGFFCSIFTLVWLFIEANFVNKIKPEAKILPLLIGAVAASFGSVIFFYVVIIAAAASGSNDAPFALMGLCGVVYLAGVVMSIVGIFKMRAAIQEYYNTVEPINLRLSGVMTFFFAVLYFQYHFTRIAEWKKTGYLRPQG